MVFPAFLAPAVRFERPPSLELEGGSASTMNELNFRVEPQEQTLWCWAAVSRSIASFYDPASQRTQCSIASEVLAEVLGGPIECCGPLASTDCNRTSRLDTALRKTGNFVDWFVLDAPRGTWPCIPFEKIREEIDGGRLIASRVGWERGGHFQVIYGWIVGASGDRYLRISDPIYKEIDILFEHFASHFQGGGWWNVSYFTDSTAAIAVAGGSPMPPRGGLEDLPVPEGDLIGA